MVVDYEPRGNNDKFVTHPSFIGAFILSNSRVIMDFYTDKIDGYRNPETTYYHTVTDSMIVHSKQAPAYDKYRKPNTLGMFALDIEGKIIKYAEPAPLVYSYEHVTPTNETKLEVKAKGYGKDEREKLTWGHYLHMMGKKSLAGRNQDTKRGGKLRCLDDGRIRYEGTAIKRNGLAQLSRRQREDGIENNSITNVVIQRTLNKTKWTKRRHIAGRADMFSLAWGSTYVL
jgi:hypothetical protein